MAEKSWYYAKEGSTYGPFAEDVLREFFANNALAPRDLVFCRGETDGWVRAAMVPGLCAELRAVVQSSADNIAIEDIGRPRPADPLEELLSEDEKEAPQDVEDALANLLPKPDDEFVAAGEGAQGAYEVAQDEAIDLSLHLPLSGRDGLPRTDGAAEAARFPGVVRRLVSSAADIVLLFGGAALAVFFLTGTRAWHGTGGETGWPDALAILLLGFLMSVVGGLGLGVIGAAMEASPLQATPGKLLTGMMITCDDGSAPGFWRAYMRRAFGLFLAVVVYALGLAMQSGWLFLVPLLLALVLSAMPVLTRGMRGPHDWLLNTVVIFRERVPEPLWVGSPFDGRWAADVAMWLGIMPPSGRQLLPDRFARIRERIGAFVDDAVITGALLAGPVAITLSELRTHGINVWRSPVIPALAAVPLCVAVLAAWAAMESWRRQATPGMRRVGIIVTDLEGRRLTFPRAFIRRLLSVMSLLTLLGLYRPVSNERGQMLHDRVAGTMVFIGRLP